MPQSTRDIHYGFVLEGLNGDLEFWSQDEIDDLVDLWHETETSANLYEFVGLHVLGLKDI